MRRTKTLAYLRSADRFYRGVILTRTKPPFWLFLSFGLIVAVAALLLIPATNQAIFGLFSSGTYSQPLAYNGFDAFIPFIPGYFPVDFEISFANNGSSTDAGTSTYTETYASGTHFFKTIQSQGSAVPALLPDPTFTIQHQPASLTNSFDLTQKVEDDLDLSQYNTHEVWMISAVLKDINIQLVTNLPKEEAIRVADGLIPSICTSTPTPER